MFCHIKVSLNQQGENMREFFMDSTVPATFRIGKFCSDILCMVEKKGGSQGKEESGNAERNRIN